MNLDISSSNRVCICFQLPTIPLVPASRTARSARKCSVLGSKDHCAPNLALNSKEVWSLNAKTLHLSLVSSTNCKSQDINCMDRKPHLEIWFSCYRISYSKRQSLKIFLIILICLDEWQKICNPILIYLFICG